MKARYLLFFSYIGTPFRSSEKLWLKQGRNYTDTDSVQGSLELALLKLQSLNYPNLTLSSRTDGGVHALNATAHFDLERRGPSVFDTDFITYSINKHFFFNNIGIFAKKCIRVQDDFNARYKALSRTYLYRLAVVKQDVDIPENNTIASYIPIEEWKKCHFVRLKNYDIEKFKEGAKYFVGTHDFSTFRKASRLTEYKHNRRDLISFTIRPAAPVVTSYTSQQGSIFDYYDIEIKGRAFVHNQIRRMIGALNSVAIGKLPPEEIKVMLQIPSKHSWYSFIQAGPPDGLYLCNVEYNPQDLVYNTESELETICDSDEECEDSRKFHGLPY